MRILILLTAACLALAAPGRAADSVDMTLVLVSDVSRSVDDAEFKLQREGYTEAFTSRQVIEAIRGGSVGAIAVDPPCCVTAPVTSERWWLVSSNG